MMMPVDSCLPVDGMPKMLGEAGHQMGARRGLNNTRSMRRFYRTKKSNGTSAENTSLLIINQPIKGPADYQSQGNC